MRCCGRSTSTTATRRKARLPRRELTGRTVTDADFAELLASAREGAQLLRGVPVPGARAWRVTPDAAPVEVPVADVAARVHAKAAEGALAEPDAAAIRRHVGLSQTEFAAALDVPVATLRNWKQGRRAPRGPARQLLHVAAVAPEVLALLRAVS